MEGGREGCSDWGGGGVRMSRLIGYSGEEGRREGCPDLGGGGGGRWQHSECLDLVGGGGGGRKEGREGYSDSDLRVGVGGKGGGVAGGKGQDV